MVGDEGTVFVTVGTTKFDELVEAVVSRPVLRALHRLGYRRVVLQAGDGRFTGEGVAEAGAECGVEVEWYRYKPGIEGDIGRASLVISHAGAGSVLECLYAGKRLVVVVNERLMGNHQQELARRLRDDGHLLYTYCPHLLDTLNTMGQWQGKPFPRGQPRLATNYIGNFLRGNA